MQIEAIPMLINGDFLNAPLDVKMHLADYKMHGKKSYVFQIKDLLHGIYECTYISLNDQDINGEALEYLIKNNKHIGEAFIAVFDLERKDTFKTLRAIVAVANSTTAMTAVLNSDETVKKFVNSPLIREVRFTGDTWNYPPQTTPVKGIIISFYCSDTNNALTVRKIDDMVVTDRNDDRNAADAGKREWKIWLARYSKNPAYNVMKKSITVAAYYANCMMRYIPID